MRATFIPRWMVEFCLIHKFLSSVLRIRESEASEGSEMVAGCRGQVLGAMTLIDIMKN